MECIALFQDYCMQINTMSSDVIIIEEAPMKKAMNRNAFIFILQNLDGRH